MASCTPLTIAIPLNEWAKNEKVKKNHMTDIKRHICALRNSNGGKLILKDETDVSMSESGITNYGLKFEDVIRSIEQAFELVVGTACLSSDLTICSETPKEIVYEVKGCTQVCTLNTNMYLPTVTQVLQIKGSEFDTMIERMNIDRIVDVTEFESDPITQFIHNAQLNIRESKTVQFKGLKSEKSKFNDLASRIINNKFTSYVSAFANHCGGRIYIGIDKDACVVGETISKREEKDLETKLKTHIDKMLWPGYCTPPEKGKQWDVAFYPVTGSDGRPVEAEVIEGAVSPMCVVVITIHSCPGGVFAKEPESYHVVENKVERMDFTEWKTRLLYPEGERNISRSLSRCEWSSLALRRKCDELDGKLLRHINYGKWQKFREDVQKEAPTADDPNKIELELVLLSKWYVYHYRRGEQDDFESAAKCLKEFNEKVSKCKDKMIFEVRGRLILSALQRTRGDHEEGYRTARDCLSLVEQLSPCILTAEFYVHFATMLTIIEGTKELRKKLKGDLKQDSFKEEAMVFYNKALEHLRKIDYVPSSKADMEQKSHINIAILKLGCSLSGDLVDDTVSSDAIKDASSCLALVNESTTKHDGNPLSGFRSCHHKFATSSLYYRRSQLEQPNDKRMALLDSAVRGAEEVEFLATKCKFHELARYARKHVTVYKTALERLEAQLSKDT